MTNVSTAVPDLGNSGSERPSLAALVGRIAGDIDSVLSPGDVANLRRLRPDKPFCPAFWKIAATVLTPGGLLPEGGPFRDDAECRWSVLLAAMAELKGLHAPRQRLGRALAEAGISEQRMLRLLRAESDALLDAVRITARHLAVKAEPVDVTGLVRLVLSDGGPAAEAVRRGIARDYYSQADQA